MGYYFLFLGGLTLAFAVWICIKNLKLVLGGVRTRGEIVAVEEQLRRGDSQQKKTYFHPVIEFQSEEGQVFQFTFGSGSSLRRPEVGKLVTVVYERGCPHKATLNSFMGLWAGPLAATILGSGCFYAGVQIVFFDA